MVVTFRPTGRTVEDLSTPESSESSLIFNGDPNVDATSTYIILTEPAGAPPDPGENPIPLPNGQFASDLVIWASKNAAPAAVFFSDNPILGNITLLSTALTFPNLFFTPETGDLQDLTPFTGDPNSTFQIMVQSDVTPIPEPDTALLLAVGLAEIAVCSLRA